MAGKSKFEWESSNMQARIDVLPGKIHERMISRVENASKRAEATMKEKAPWRDITGKAREGLFARPLIPPNPGLEAVFSIVLGHSVSYGIWLETIQSGKYEIIMPTTLAIGKALMRSFTGLLNELEAASEVAIEAPSSGEGGTSQGPSVYAERGARTVKRRAKRTLEENEYLVHGSLVSKYLVQRVSWKRNV